MAEIVPIVRFIQNHADCAAQVTQVVLSSHKSIAEVIPMICTDYAVHADYTDRTNHADYADHQKGHTHTNHANRTDRSHISHRSSQCAENHRPEARATWLMRERAPPFSPRHGPIPDPEKGGVMQAWRVLRSGGRHRYAVTLRRALRPSTKMTSGCVQLLVVTGRQGARCRRVDNGNVPNKHSGDSPPRD